MKKLLHTSILLSLICVLILNATGCSAPSSQASSAASSKAADTAASSQAASETEPALTPEKITVLSGAGAMNGIYDDSIAKEIFEKKFGLTMDFLSFGDKFDEKLAAEMSSGSLPDLVCFKDKKQFEVAIQAGLVMELEELLEQHGKDISENLPDMVRYMRENVSNSTGKLYGITNQIGKQTYTNGVHLALYTRYDLLKQLGNPKIDTYDQMLDILKQMQDLQPKTDDGKNIYGLTLWSDWDAKDMVMIDWTLLNYKGLNVGQDNGTLAFSEYNQDTKTLGDMFDENSEYLKAVEFYFKANQMGILDPDSITQKFDNVLTKLDEGRLLTAFWGWMADSFNSGSYTKKNENAAMVPVFPLQDAKLMLQPETAIGREFVWAIGSKTKYADRIFKLLNYAATVEGTSQLFNGVQGIDWDIVDGKAQYTEAVLEKIKNSDPTVKYIGIYEPLTVLGIWNTDPRTGEAISYQGWSQVMKATALPSVQEWLSENGITGAYGYAEKLGIKKVQNDGIPYMASSPPDDIKVVQQKLSELTKEYSWKMVYAKNPDEFAVLKAELIQKAKAVGSDQSFEWAKTELEAAKKNAGTYTQVNVK